MPSDAKEMELSSQFIEMLMTIHNNFYRQTQIPLPLNQFAVLVAVRSEAKASITQIAENLRVSKQQMTAIMDKLLAAGIVAKEKDPSDRRCCLVSLTQKGEAVLAEQDEKVKTRLNERLAALSSDQLETFRQSLTTVTQTIDSMFPA